MAKHETGTREKWLAARLELLQAEKETARTRHVTGELRNRWMGSCPRVARRRQEGPPGVARCTQRRAPLCRLCPAAGCRRAQCGCCASAWRRRRVSPKGASRTIPTREALK